MLDEKEEGRILQPRESVSALPVRQRSCGRLIGINWIKVACKSTARTPTEYSRRWRCEFPRNAGQIFKNIANKTARAKLD